MKSHEQYRGMLYFSIVLLCLKLWLLISSIALDCAATLFTPETPKVFCGLKQFTHPSIGE